MVNGILLAIVVVVQVVIVMMLVLLGMGLSSELMMGELLLLGLTERAG